MMSQTSSLYHHLLFLILIAQIKLSRSSFTSLIWRVQDSAVFLLFEFEFVSSLPLLHWHIPRVGGGRKKSRIFFLNWSWGWKFLVTPYVFTQHEYIIYLNWSNSILNTILLPFLFSLLVCFFFLQPLKILPLRMLCFFSSVFQHFLAAFFSTAAAHNTEMMTMIAGNISFGEPKSM